MQDFPSISLATCADRRARGGEIRKLREACLRHGFFFLRDHGVRQALVDEAIEASAAFFELPAEVKSAYGHEAQSVHPRFSRGYVPLNGETLDEDVGPDPKEVFDLGIEQAPSGEPFVGRNVLPDEKTAPHFATSLFALQDQILNAVVPRLTQALALALHLDARWFDEYFVNPTLIQRVIKYPPGHSTAGKHTDNGFFTVLIQEMLPTPSLYVYTGGAWMQVPSVEQAFVINLGDMLQLWTDGLFVSTPHKVVHRSAKGRISLPFFVYPDIGAQFRSLKSGTKYRVKDIMLKNFGSIWIAQTGAGRAKELV